MNGKNGNDYGLLYQRDKGSNFPFDEIKRAIECFHRNGKTANCLFDKSLGGPKTGCII